VSGNIMHGVVDGMSMGRHPAQLRSAKAVTCLTVRDFRTAHWPNVTHECEDDGVVGRFSALRARDENHKPSAPEPGRSVARAAGGTLTMADFRV
jgi:hypothetical protein